jgi:hypothetical protein
MLINLKKILELSKAIKQQCDCDLWEEMEASQTIRAELMHELDVKSAPSSADDIDKCRSLSLEIQKINDEILLLSQNNKSNLLDEIRRSNKSKKMSNAYGK